MVGVNFWGPGKWVGSRISRGYFVALGMSEKVIIQPCDLQKQKIIESWQYEIELFEKYFKIMMRFKANEPENDDEAQAWREVMNDFEMAYPKHKFAGLEKVWLQEAKRWKIVISIDGIGSDLKIYFKRQTHCEEVYQKLFEYFFGNGK
jgi:hypothetical protein